MRPARPAPPERRRLQAECSQAENNSTDHRELQACWRQSTMDVPPRSGRRRCGASVLSRATCRRDGRRTIRCGCHPGLLRRRASDSSPCGSWGMKFGTCRVIASLAMIGRDLPAHRHQTGIARASSGRVVETVDLSASGDGDEKHHSHAGSREHDEHDVMAWPFSGGRIIL